MLSLSLLFFFAQAVPPVEMPSSVSPEFIGMVALALSFLTKWVWEYKKQSREEAAEVEPRANPPLHKQFVSREEFTPIVARIDEIAKEFRAGLSEADRKRSVSIAGLHDDLTAGIDKIRAEIRQDNAGVHNRITEVIGLVRELKGRIDSK